MPARPLWRQCNGPWRRDLACANRMGKHAYQAPRSNLCSTLQRRHNECDGVSNHRCLECLPNLMLRPRSTKTSKLCVTVFVRGIHQWPIDFLHKRPVTRPMFSFISNDVIMMYHSGLPHCDWGNRTVEWYEWMDIISLLKPYKNTFDNMYWLESQHGCRYMVT